MVDLGPIGSMVGLGGFNFSSVLSTVVTISKIVGIAILTGIFVFLVFRWRKNRNKGMTREIHWWEESVGGLVPTRIDFAEEVIIPGTNLRMFYIKDRDTWLFRFTRGITPSVFFVAITKNKEIVNFTLKSLDSHMKEAQLDFDHTDMRWAAENMREWVKRNYKDKSQKWWKEYQGVITTAIFILVMTFSLCIIIYFMKGMVGQLGSISGGLKDVVDQCRAAQGSGVVQAG